MREHRDLVEQLTAEQQIRRQRGQRHPVWDFMFSYYPVTPGKLKKWHPGFGVVLLASKQEEFPVHLRKYYNNNDNRLTFDQEGYWQHRAETVRYVHQLLSATFERPARFNCFGLHEWAMVYRDDRRHPDPLRLGIDGTNKVVEESNLRCTHYDAFRFFTPEAVPRNASLLRREDQIATDQPGCVHAGMDLYKWTTKLGALIPGELWLKTFRLACDFRALDMKASPYDLSDWGFDPIGIESSKGRAEYVRHQKQLSKRSQVLRLEILSIMEKAFPQLVRGT